VTGTYLIRGSLSSCLKGCHKLLTLHWVHTAWPSVKSRACQRPQGPSGRLIHLDALRSRDESWPWVITCPGISIQHGKSWASKANDSILVQHATEKTRLARGKRSCIIASGSLTMATIGCSAFAAQQEAQSIAWPCRSNACG